VRTYNKVMPIGIIRRYLFDICYEIQYLTGYSFVWMFLVRERKFAKLFRLGE
jgi:hypothetical protein